jgi:hypothetical protein
VHLLLAVLHHEELLDEVLSVLLEHELQEAVVVESRTGLELLERDLPIFAGLRSLIPGGIDFSRLVLCVVEDDQVASAALIAVRDLGAGASAGSEPRNAVFLVPLSGLEYF